MSCKMLSLIILPFLAACTQITQAAPTAKLSQDLTNFLLVTTSQSERCSNSSRLAHVSATSLFDPFDETNFLLRLIGPGYESLPKFNLSSAGLHTLSEGIEGSGLYVYNSTRVQTGAELQFVPSNQKAGNLGLKDGYLLTVGGKAKGWSICAGELEEQVISWQGMDSTCVETYIQAVMKAPY